MLIRRHIPSVVRWSIWPLRWSTGEDTRRVQTGGLWEYLWYATSQTSHKLDLNRKKRHGTHVFIGILYIKVKGKNLTYGVFAV